MQTRRQTRRDHRAGSGIRSGLAYATVFGGAGAVQSFSALWLHSLGFAASEIGPILGVLLCVRVVLGPLAGIWAERCATLGRPLALLCLGAACASVLLLLPGHNALHLLGLGLLASCVGVCLPLLDSANLQQSHRRPDLFCLPRRIGAVAYLIGSLLFSVCATVVGIGQALPLWSLAGALLAAFALPSLLSRPTVRMACAASVVPASTAPDRRIMLAILALSASMLVQSSHGLNALLMLDWHLHGRSAWECALLWQIGPASDIALFWLAGRFVLQPSTLLVMGAFAATLRWVGYALSPSLWLICGLQILHTLSSTASYVAVVQLIDQLVPARRGILAQATSWAMMNGLAKGVVTLASGWLYVRYARDSYWIMAALAATGLMLAIALKARLGRIRTSDLVF